MECTKKLLATGFLGWSFNSAGVVGQHSHLCGVLKVYLVPLVGLLPYHHQAFQIVELEVTLAPIAFFKCAACHTDADGCHSHRIVLTPRAFNPRPVKNTIICSLVRCETLIFTLMCYYMEKVKKQCCKHRIFSFLISELTNYIKEVPLNFVKSYI
jgi:hypothetical protein